MSQATGRTQGTNMDRAERLDHWDAQARPLVLPSLLDCDFARMDEELKALQAADAGALHLDVMDGHFVANLTYGPPIIADWRPLTTLPFDVHLMIADPARYADAFLAAGCDLVLFHIEVEPEPTALLRSIRRQGARAGLVLNPETPVDAVLPYLSESDRVLVMSVSPGQGGQAFDSRSLEKVRRIRRERPALPVAIDGGIKPANAARAVAAGVSELIVGSFIFRSGGDYRAALTEVTAAARQGLDSEEVAETIEPSPPRLVP